MGIHQKLEALLSGRLGEFRAKGHDLWDRLSKIVEELGKKDSTVCSDHTNICFEFVFKHNSSTCKIVKANYVYGGYYITFTVNGEQVLDVDERDGGPTSRDSAVDRSLFVQAGEDWYLVRAYKPGEWENWLDFDELKSVVDAEKKKVQKAEAAHRRETELERPLDEEEKKLAERFGFKL